MLWPQGLDQLVETLLARAVPKAVHGAQLTGPLLASLVQVGRRGALQGASGFGFF